MEAGRAAVAMRDEAIVGVRAQGACGSKEGSFSYSPFPFPLGKAGAGEFPPRRWHLARPANSAGTRPATGSPHKRGKPPLCIPPGKQSQIFC
jgi:hypothetical protein